MLEAEQGAFAVMMGFEQFRIHRSPDRWTVQVTLSDPSETFTTSSAVSLLSAVNSMLTVMQCHRPEAVG